MKQLISILGKRLLFLCLVLFSLVPLVWFYGKGDVLINGIDTNFPLNPLVWFLRRFYVWSSLPNAGADFSSSTAGLFFHFIQVVPYFLGLNLQIVEIVSLVFWFSLIVFSAYVFARVILPKNSYAQLLFVVFYVFNIYLFNSWENVKVANLSLIASIPLALSVLTLLKNQEISLGKALFYSSLVGIVLSGSGINPSYFITFFLILAIYFIGLVVSELDWKNVLIRCRQFLSVSLIIILVNAFWIFPTINYIFKNIGSSGSIEVIGFNNWVDSLSGNTSLMNVLRMQGAWDWYAFDSVSGLPLYIPYALNYFYRLPFLIFSFLVPAIAILSLIFRDKKRNYIYLSFGVMLILGVFLGAGTHLPTGEIFRLLLNKLPFFSLFRSPWYIFTPLVSLSLAGLLALFFDSFTLSRYLKIILVLILVVGNLLYSYPLITGKIFRPDRKDGFFLQFPSYVFNAEKWLSSQPATGRIIEYPDEEITQFSWGYRGVESILNLFSGRDSLFPSLNAPDANISKLIKRYYLDIKKGSIASSNNLAYKMNIEYLFNKGDVNSLALNLSEEIKKLPSINFSDRWYFYKVLAEPAPRIYAADSFYFGSPFDKAHESIAVLSPLATLFNSQDNIVKDINLLTKNAGWVILAENSQAKDLYDFFHTPANLANRLMTRNMGKVDFTFEIPQEGFYEPILERYQLEELGIGKEKELGVEVNGQKATWKITSISDSYMYFEKMNLKKGFYKVSLNLEKSDLIYGGDFQGEAKYQKSYGKEAKVAYSILADGEEKYLDILNTSKVDVSADFLVSSFDPLVPYYVEFKYKQIHGNNALVLAGQNNKATLIKTQQERLPNYPLWSDFSFYYQPVITDSQMKIILSAPFTNDPFGTKVYYDNISVYRVFTNNLLLLKEEKTKLSLPEVSSERISPVEYRIKITRANGPHILVFSENYSPDWEISLIGNKPNNFIARHFSANLYANAWYLENSPADYELEIYYKPQKWFVGGLVVSGIALIGSLLILAKNYKEKKYE